jgi:outer membrane protein OmpA-like peptidoglycan-associated protein
MLILIGAIFFVSSCWGSSDEISNTTFGSVPIVEDHGLMTAVVENNSKYEAYGYIAFVIGNTANEPIPSVGTSGSNLSAFTNSALFSLWENHGYVKFFSAAGSEIEHGQILLDESEIKPISRDARAKTNTKNAEANYKILNTAFAVDPGVSHLDFVGAMKNAAEFLRGSGGESDHKLMVVIGSGLNDAGILNFAENPELINMPPQEITSKIMETESERTFSGIDVVFSGLGNTVSPQNSMESLGKKNSKENLRNIYKSLIESLGGNCLYMDESQSDSKESIETNYKVTPVDFGYDPDDVVWEVEEPIRLTESLVSFVGDKAEFIDKKKAIETLDEYVAQKLKSDTNLKITITGYVARAGSEAKKYSGELDYKRAQAVQDVLVNDLGVDSKQISTVSGGGFGIFADESKADGKYDEVAAKQNRVVVIERVE